MSNNILDILAAAAAPAAPLCFTRFDNVADTTNGEQFTVPWSEWIAQRNVAATWPWPSNGWLAQRLTESDDPEIQIAYVKEAKKELPVEVGAALTGGRRKDDAVESISWLFVDVDGVEDVEAVKLLHGVLKEASINHLLIESPTSRLAIGTEPRGLRVHLYVQIAPLYLPAASLVPRRDVKAWWRSLFAVAAAAITESVGLSYDTSVDDMAQPCFVSHIPLGCDGRRRQWLSDGQALDLERLATILGHELPRPGSVVEASAPKAPPAATTAAPAAAPAPMTEPSASRGPTPNQTTGSLIMLAMQHFGLLTDRNGRQHCIDRTAGKWLCRCPWADQHRSDPRQTMGLLDNSTVIYDSTANGDDGGFDCKHDGCRDNGRKRDAADVLRWARFKGCPLPDRASFGSGEASEQSKPSGKPSGKPKIAVRQADIAGMRDAAIAALRNRADIYVRDWELVDLTPNGSRAIPADHLMAVLSEVATWVSYSRNEADQLVEKPAKVPRDVVGAVLKAASWPGIAELKSIVRHPILLGDGRLITAPGYDAESKLLFIPDEAFSIPAKPTRDEALAAKDRLLRYVRNTNFCDSRGPSSWLAFVLTLAARHAFPTAPLFGFDAAVAGAGKTSLVKIAYGLIHGDLPQLGAPVVKDDAEAEKRLPMWGKQALVCWDNVKEIFASPVVDGAITAGKQNVRCLGRNEGLLVDLTGTCWAMTGNNLAVGDDAASRCIITRIQAPTTRRYDFAVDDVAFYRAQRSLAVADALTMLRAFIIAGMPQKEDVPYCRFVEWSRLVRQTLLWLGLDDPIGGEIVDTNLEAKAAALRAIAQWQMSKLTEEERQARGLDAYECSFYAGDLDVTSVLKLRSEDDEAYRLRRAVADALGAVYGRKITNTIHAGYALGKLRDVRLPLTTGQGHVVFSAEKKGAKTSYRLDLCRE